MTKNDLNRDIKKLKSEFYRIGFWNLEYQEKQMIGLEKEFKRLYNADSNFEYMNKDSILTMLRLNLKYRFIDLHLFGINIDLWRDSQ